ncbi:hypothetical protein A2972_03645 [Candidatus Amesbacteria bacterium RIFCSPLOWO2_01_FULL_47_33]|uniref:Uncharacterized protein n=1 Tax=Candidatus Amesbacteria bacterium RIFCSPLOWO2_01_FULL_47_33 TaxID=1797258 RepID=A0A1F4Z423_9BACT|nr:MAG: hypothetical protein A2972_03645 [Candidatus Amesbacteria bacterium RIFCSPLOWO2_01_FULL_47_33]
MIVSPAFGEEVVSIGPCTATPPANGPGPSLLAPPALKVSAYTDPTCVNRIANSNNKMPNRFQLRRASIPGAKFKAYMGRVETEVNEKRDKIRRIKIFLSHIFNFIQQQTKDGPNNPPLYCLYQNHSLSSNRLTINPSRQGLFI